MTTPSSISHIVNTSVQDGINSVKYLMANQPTAETLKILHEAEVYESCNSRRTSLLEALIRAQSQVAKQLKKSPPALELEVVFAPDGAMLDLSQIASDIESTIDKIEQHEGAFQDATLKHRLILGLHVAKAMEAFSLGNDERQGVGGRGKKTESRRDSVSEDEVETDESDENTAPTNFLQWLGKSSKRLGKPVAYKYAKAFRGLGLDHKATPEQVGMTLDTLRYSNKQSSLPAPSLASLTKAAPRLPKPAKAEISKPEDSALIRLGDARESVQSIKDDWDKLLTKGQLDDLEKQDLEDLKTFLTTARDRVTNRLKKA